MPPPAEPTEEQQLAALLADLARFTALNADDIRRETAAATQALARSRNDANRIRLAMLYTLGARDRPTTSARSNCSTTCSRDRPRRARRCARSPRC